MAQHRARLAFAALVGISLFAVPNCVLAQQDPEPPPPPPTAKAAAPVDFTGQWMGLITEDWGYRMVMPIKGDFRGVPLNPTGKKAAEAWDPTKANDPDDACKAYGVGGIMRIPGRIRISWADDDTLKLETDSGTQTRMLYFKEPKSKGGDLQGISSASWELIGGGAFQGNGGPGLAARLSGSLKVVTTGMKAGYLRKNGVPYSDKAVITEYFDKTTDPDLGNMLVVVTVVSDPEYLLQEFITSAHFVKQKDQSGWNPTSCSAH